MRKRIFGILCVTLLLFAAVVLQVGWMERNYIAIGDVRMRRDATQADFSGAPVGELEKLKVLTSLTDLDLRNTGLTAAEYETLKEELPGCTIRWSVPFQGGYLEETVTELTVTELAEGDLAALAYLKDLQVVHARKCRDYDVLIRLMEKYPQLEVDYRVEIGGQLWENGTEEMTLDFADADVLEQNLPWLTQLKTVTFTGGLPDGEAVCRLMTLAPQVSFAWEVPLFGQTFSSLVTELNLSDIPMESVETVENALKYFPNLQRVEMCNCGIPSQEMDALGKRHPEIRFVWTVKVGRCTLRTDDTTFMPWKFGYTLNRGIRDEECEELKYCTDLICLDFGHMLVSDYSFLEYMPKMKYLVLAETRGTDFSVLANLKELVFLELFLTNFDQLELLQGLTKLEDLNISYNRVPDITPLMEMTWLKRLWMVGVYPAGQDWQALQAALPDTIINLYGKSSTEGAWRLSPNYKAMRDLLGVRYMYG